MFSRALNQIERQRVHLGQSGLSTTDIKRWLLLQDDLAALADGAIDLPLTPLFATPAEMIDVAEAELCSGHNIAAAGPLLPDGEDAPLAHSEELPLMTELDDWLQRLTTFGAEQQAATGPLPLEQALLPASFAIASYRASLLPLLGDGNESATQGASAELARLPLVFTPGDGMQKLNDPQVAAISNATLSVTTDSDENSPHE
jgi:hypothetical protein